jgi:hypothetical protein
VVFEVVDKVSLLDNEVNWLLESSADPELVYEIAVEQFEDDFDEDEEETHLLWPSDSKSFGTLLVSLLER